MGITDWEIIFCRGISEGSVDKKISTREFKNRTVYDCFSNPFVANCGSPYFNLPPVPIDDGSFPDKRARYTPDLLPAAIFVTFENSVSTLTTPSDSIQFLVLAYDYPNPHHAMNKDDPYRVREKRGYCFRKCDEKYAKKAMFYCSTCSNEATEPHV